MKRTRLACGAGVGVRGAAGQRILGWRTWQRRFDRRRGRGDRGRRSSVERHWLWNWPRLGFRVYAFIYTVEPGAEFCAGSFGRFLDGGGICFKAASKPAEVGIDFEDSCILLKRGNFVRAQAFPGSKMGPTRFQAVVGNRFQAIDVMLESWSEEREFLAAGFTMGRGFEISAVAAERRIEGGMEWNPVNWDLINFRYGGGHALAENSRGLPVAFFVVDDAAVKKRRRQTKKLAL